MRKNRRTTAVIAALAGLALALTACGGGSPDSPDSTSGTETEPLTIALSRMFAGAWYPPTWNWSTYTPLQEASYSGLIERAPGGEYVPSLATEWSYDSPTAFRMKLREGVKFSDGEVFDATAVKVNLEAAKDVVGPFTSAIADLTEVEVVNDHEVVIHSSAVIPDLELILSQTLGLMVSPAAVKDLSLLEQGPVGAGPYLLNVEESVAEDTYVFEKNPDYFDPGRVKFENLTIRVIPDAQAASAAVQSGQVDISWARYQTVEASRAAGVNILESLGTTLQLQFVDLAGDEFKALGDTKVRQALNYAIDREAIAENLSPGRVTSQFLNVASDGYLPELDDWYEYDPDKARELLPEAGYADGFTFQVLSVPGNDEAALQAVAGYFKDVGVEMELVLKPIAEFVPSASAGEYATTFSPSTSLGSAYLDLQPFISPDGGKNNRQFVDQEMIDALDKAANTIDPQERAQAYQEINKMISERAWFAVVQQSNVYYLYNDRVDELVEIPGYLFPTIRYLQPAAG